MGSTGTRITSPGRVIEVSVASRGRRLELYRRLDGRYFVAGIPGDPYRLKVRNLTDGRIEVITTVDGRNTQEDEPGDQEKNRGLVFGAHDDGEFTGFRLSRDETREFVFSDPAASVAAQVTGSTANAGVIGLAAYREQQRVHLYSNQPVTRGYVAGQSANMTVASAGAATADSAPGLGTAMGERQEDKVTPTSFTRSGGPDVVVIGYDTEDALRAAGIIGPREPDPFPASGQTGYARL
jgi:hypothetical protein